jgi:hypothetical protein
MRRLLPILTVALTVATALPPAVAQAAGEVRVRFAPVAQLSDIGRGIDAQRKVQALTERLQALAARLPDGQVLDVQVLDVKLAGELRPLGNGEEVRVLQGRADWPALELAWRLDRGSQTLASGHDRLSDMNYLNEPLRRAQDSSLPYEGRLIERWFDSRVAAAAATP